MKTILLWDQRYPDRPPHRMSVNDTFASAMVRAGLAAPIDPADFATLNVGGALDLSTPTEIALEDSVSKRMRRIYVPASVAAIAVSLGVGASTGRAISATPAPTPNPSPTPTPTPTPSVTYAFPAVQAKRSAGQRAQIGVIGDSAVAGWGGGVATGTANGTGAGSPPNYLRVNAWPQQLRALLAALGQKVRSDAYFSCSSGTSISDLQAANPNIVLGSGWVLGNTGLSGTILQCPNTSTAATTFTPEVAADTFEFYCSSQAGVATFTVSDSDGVFATIDTSNQSGAQVIVGSLGLKRFTATRAVPSTKPISIARNGTGGTLYIQGIVPSDTTNPMLEILNMGWPASRAYGTDGSTPHWNIWATPSSMNASTPYNALGVLSCDGYIVELGTNDANASIAASDFQTAMTNIASKLKGQASNNGANVALVKCRTTIGGYASYNMSADMLAVIDTVTANLSLAPIINYNAINFVTTDRFDGTHPAQPGYGKEAVVSRQWLVGA